VGVAKVRIGDKFGKLTVLKKMSPSKNGVTRWLCLCSCPNQGLTVLKETNLECRLYYRCAGCSQKAILKLEDKHGEIAVLIYNRWRSMMRRCYETDHPNYSNYGKKGITVCNTWRLNFLEFFDWMMNQCNGNLPKLQKLTIERLNNRKSYGPKNCILANRVVQANNRSNNRKIVCWGVAKTARQWSNDKRCVVSYNHLIKRLRGGWRPDLAMTRP
jgi:hypothetical protein